MSKQFNRTPNNIKQKIDTKISNKALLYQVTK